MTYLLDPCAFLWLAVEPARLSGRARTAFDGPGNTFHLSEASCWEIVLKYSAGKLPLPAPPRDWIPRQVNFFQLVALPIEQDEIFESGELPRIHSDPFDRLLTAQSLAKALPVVTPDRAMANLDAQTLW